ncbi:uncharacterized protein LOC108204684 isoform X2 [Daucus carota subsp. sativus]|uniref:uncharacterized protein LOC108204684 isoform X2 n=1 Tax=Daucus carota subsp. sativus TaxID=79200 RepID=UPI0007EFBD6E|nr:PREDICTED: uncharacterized protein LOC108204684 isoform X2 [Daucus carota subsp. sativus]
MRNLDDAYLSSKTMIKALVFVILLSLSFRSISAVDFEDEDGLVQWQILTKFNFSSQIRTHPHILLLITVPWFGESRSLMRDLAQVVNSKQKKFGTLKLMFVHRNSDKVLAEALGAKDGIKFLYFRQSLSYKYQGPLRVQNILSSVYHLMSLPPKDIPLKFLTTAEDLKSFTESTDKVLLVMEFCGWTSRLLTKAKNSVTDNGFESIFNIANGTFSPGGKNMQKIESEQNCGAYSGNLWTGEFSANNMSQFPGSGLPTDGDFCSSEEFHKYETFLVELSVIAKEFFLPPERIRFGLVQERALLSFLGIKYSGPWLAMLHFAGCPSCSKVLGEGDDIRHAIKMQASPVLELEGDANGLDPPIPANKPSIVLFIDRSSESLDVRKKSSEALGVFRELALHHQMNEETTAKSQRTSMGNYQSSLSTLGHPKFDMSPSSQKITELKDKMSVMLLDKGKHITINKAVTDLQGGSLQEILTYLIQHKKEIKISSLAKNAGFQLLSDDFTVKVAEESPADLNVQSNQVSTEVQEEHPEGSDSGHLRQNQTPHMAGGRVEKPENSADGKQKEVKETIVDSTKVLSAGIDSRYNVDHIANTAHSEKIPPNVDHNFPGSVGSFFFSDGGFRLLKALAPSSSIPIVVIIDPLSHKHYLFPEEEVFGYSSLSNFLERFNNGSLVPYKHSETFTRASRESPRPPFVNSNFHAVNSVPRLTTNTFLELVVGNQSDMANSSNAWKKDVLVLFSNTWCGFCQRMELVVREVYSAFKGYSRMLKDKPSLISDNVENTNLKLPLIYLMDCTLNDCSLILNSSLQRDLYPSLLLFPAERKEAVPYGGDITVTQIINFIAEYGSNSERLFGENGFLWNKASQRVKYGNLHKDVTQTSNIKDPSSLTNIYHEVLLKDRAQKIEVKDYEMSPQRYNRPHEIGTDLVAGSILVASEKLVNVHPFDGSKILIVKVNQSTGFQGVIINKHISWDTLGKLDEGLELLKRAPLSLGGPVIIRGMPLVSLSRKLMKYRDQTAEPEIHFLDQWETLDVIKALQAGDRSISDYWFFMGYSSWEWKQLFDEIAEGSWKISNGMEHLEWPESD